jgi:hypothetical protein
MNKVLLLVAFMAYMPCLSKAQSDRDYNSRTNVNLGLKLGLNYSNVYDSKGEDFNADPKVGFVAGAFLSIPIWKYIGVQPEILFSQKGFQATGRLLGNTYSFKRTTNYISVPLLLAIKPIPAVTVLAGPQYAYLLKRKDVFSDGNSNVIQQEEFKNENIRKNTLGFVGGLDINLRKVVIGARAGWDLQNNNGDGTSSTPRYKNAWLQGTLGFRI